MQGSAWLLVARIVRRTIRVRNGAKRSTLRRVFTMATGWPIMARLGERLGRIEPRFDRRQCSFECVRGRRRFSEIGAGIGAQRD